MATTRKRCVSLFVEALEDRTVPTKFNPTNLSDALDLKSLRGCIIQANNDGKTDDVIILQPGTYHLSLQNLNGQENHAKTGDLDITNALHHLSIKGTGTPNNPTVVDASGLANPFDGTNSDRVFQIFPGVSVEFDNLIIKNGIARDNGVDKSKPGTTDAVGGGILNQGGNVVLDKTTIQECQAIGGPGTTPTASGENAKGGGIASFGGSLIVTRSLLNHDNAIGGAGADGMSGSSPTTGGPGGTAEGGGIFVQNAKRFLMRSSRSSDNQALGGAGGSGGSAQFVGASGDLGGFARGGGLEIVKSNAEIGFSVIASNQARGGDGGNGASGFQTNANGASGGLGGDASGGGLAAMGGSLSLTFSSIFSNTAQGGDGGLGSLGDGGAGAVGGAGQGGGLWLDGVKIVKGSVGLPVVAYHDDHITGNVATGGAGGAGGNSGASSHFHGSSGGAGADGGSGQGGGVFVIGAPLVLSNSPILNNHAFGGGGGGGGIGNTGTGIGGDGGVGGAGGSAQGGGVFFRSDKHTLAQFRASQETVSSNQAIGGIGGSGGNGAGVAGGDAITSLVGGTAGNGGGGGSAQGGGMFVADAKGIFASVRFGLNTALGGDGASGGIGGTAMGSTLGSIVGGLGGNAGAGGNGQGGGIFSLDTSLMIRDSRFGLEHATGGVGAHGGNGGFDNDGGDAGGGGVGGAGQGAAIFSDAGMLSFLRSMVLSSLAQGGLGGMGGAGGDGQGGNGGVPGVGATGGAGQGGAFYAFGASVDLNASTLAKNSADGAKGGQGGFRGLHSKVDEVGGKGGAGQGGGLFLWQSSGRLTNSTVSDNSVIGGAGGAEGGFFGLGGDAGAGAGGGIFDLQFGPLSLRSATIAYNHAQGNVGGAGNPDGNNSDGTGGGIFTDHGAVGSVNTIIAMNLAKSGPDFSGALNANFTLLGKNDGTVLMPGGAGNIVGTSAHSIDPLLGPLGNHGGPTMTRQLHKTSLAIDAGDSASIPGPKDQRGFPRVLNIIDMGAVENQGAKEPPIGDTRPGAKRRRLF